MGKKLKKAAELKALQLSKGKHQELDSSLKTYTKLQTLSTNGKELKRIYEQESYSFVATNLAAHPNTPLSVVRSLLERYGDPTTSEYDTSLTGILLRRRELSSEILVEQYRRLIVKKDLYLLTVLMPHENLPLSILGETLNDDSFGTYLGDLVDARGIILRRPDVTVELLLQSIKGDFTGTHVTLVAERLCAEFPPYKGLPVEWVEALIAG